MVEIDKGITHIVPLTYGVMPRYADRNRYRLTVDSALAATAAEELHTKYRSEGRKMQIFIPGATFFEGTVDAKLMRKHITHPNRPTEHRVLRSQVDEIGTCTNTPTQMAEIKRRQASQELGKVALICASWQKDDSSALMRGYGIQGTLYTDKDILYDNPRHRNTFDQQEHTATYQQKKNGLFPKIFKVLNKIDRKGRVRMVLTQIVGVGIADWEYRGVTKNANTWLDRRAGRVESQRLLHKDQEPK